jgi:isopenicillin N synthase-like dioxygenase
MQMQMLAQSRAFFALPEAAKRMVLANALNRGYTPFEEEVGEVKPSRESTSYGACIAPLTPLQLNS